MVIWGGGREDRRMREVELGFAWSFSWAAGCWLEVGNDWKIVKAIGAVWRTCFLDGVGVVERIVAEKECIGACYLTEFLIFGLGAAYVPQNLAPTYLLENSSYNV